jgi:predicted ATPase
LTHDAPIVLVLEDLQWADPSTLSLIEVLGRTRTPMQIMLIGTYHTGNLASGEQELRALRQDLQLHHLCVEVPLEPLTEHDIATYLTGQVSGEVPPRGLADFIYRHSEGNPLFMVALLEHLCQLDLLTKVEGAWQMQAPLNSVDFDVPETLREMIEASITRLSTEEQRLLEVASIVGVEFYPQWCAEAAGLDPEHTEELCQALARRHCMLRPAQNQPSSPRNEATRYEFVHAMHREVLCRRQTPTRRAGLHFSVARWLESAFPAARTQLATVLGHHLERSGRPADAERSRLLAQAAHSPEPEEIGGYERTSLGKRNLLRRGPSRIREAYRSMQDSEPQAVRLLPAAQD